MPRVVEVLGMRLRRSQESTNLSFSLLAIRAAEVLLAFGMTPVSVASIAMSCCAVSSKPVRETRERKTLVKYETSSSSENLT